MTQQNRKRVVREMPTVNMRVGTADTGKLDADGDAARSRRGKLKLTKRK